MSYLLKKGRKVVSFTYVRLPLLFYSETFTDEKEVKVEREEKRLRRDGNTVRSKDQEGPASLNFVTNSWSELTLHRLF